MSPAKLGISDRRKLRANQVALIGKKKHGRAVGCQVNTGASPQSGDCVGLPQFAPGGGLEADEQSSRARAVNKIIFQKWRRSIAENAARARWSVGPENFCRRLRLIELKHQTADEEPVSLPDRS